MTHSLIRTQKAASSGDAQIPGGGELLDREPGLVAGIDPGEFEKYRAQLTRYACWLLHNRDAAEDAVQETLLAALHASRSFGGRSSVRTWLFGILKHKVMDVFRHQTREVRLAEDGDEERGDAAAYSGDESQRRVAFAHWGDPEQTLQQKRFFEELERCIGRLPKNTARVFTMHEIQGMGTAEICRAVGITPDYCFVILHRARAALRALLERDWPGRPVTRPR